MNKNILTNKISTCDFFSALLTTAIFVFSILIVVILVGVTLYATIFDTQSLIEKSPPLYAVVAVLTMLFFVLSAGLLLELLKTKEKDLKLYILSIGKINAYEEMKNYFPKEEYSRISKLIDSAI